MVGQDQELWWRCFGALTLTLLSGWISNTYLYPYYVTLLPVAREVSSFVTVALLVVIAFMALRAPRRLNIRFLTVLSLCAYILAMIFIYVSLMFSMAWLLALASSLRAVGAVWCTVMAGVSLAQLEARPCMLGVASAFFASHLLRLLVGWAGESTALTLMVLLPFLTVLIIYRPAASMFGIAREAEPSAELQITHPDSVLHFSHRFFIAILFFRVAFGLALTFGSEGGNPVQTLLPIIPLAVVFVMPFLPRVPKADYLYQMAALFVIAGFLLAMVDGTGANNWTVGLLYSGSECFDILMYFVLARVGNRNKANAISVFAWGRAASSFGLVIGADIGHSINAIIQTSTLTVSIVLAVVLFLFVTVNLTIMKNFGFQDTIDGVKEPLPLNVTNLPDTALEERCTRVAARYRLTPRESELLELLARGRNGHYIQEYLTLSYNTVKTHVANIYAKLGIHSQQELIDMVERAPRT